MATKDGEIDGLKVRLVALEQTLETLCKMHEASNDREFICMIKNMLEHNKKIKDLTNDKAYLQTQLVALEEQTGI